MTASVLDRRSTAAHAAPIIHHRITKVDGVNIFYHEAGPAHAPALLLLRRFPTSSRMFRTPSAWRRRT